MSKGPLFPLLSLLVLGAVSGIPPAQEEVRPVAILEGLDGSLTQIPLTELELTDPRARGAWFLRPAGFWPPELAAVDGASLANLQLTSGDRLRGHVRGGEGESLAVDLVGEATLSLDIGELEGMVFPARVPRGFDGALEPADEGDRLYRVAGDNLDRIDGTVASFSDAGVTYESVLGSRLFPWEEVAALFVEAFDERPPTADKDAVPIVLDLIDESRLRGALIGLDGLQVTMRVGSGEPVEIAWGYVRELFVDDGRLAFLSDFTAVREEGRGSPFGDELGMVWPHRVDRSVLGYTLRCGGQNYMRGIGTHAPSRVFLDLAGEWSLLRGLVGIDDSALLNPKEASGSVIFRIHGDGRLLWESGVLRGGDQPLAFPELDVTGIRSLVLESDAVGDFAGDRANWLRPLLSRS